MRDNVISATTALPHSTRFLGLKMLLTLQVLGILATAVWIIIH